MYRLDIRTYHVLRRVLSEISEELSVGERHFLQDVLRWTVDCHRERVVNRLRTWDGGRVNRTQGLIRNSLRITGNNPMRCHRCHQSGNNYWTIELIAGHRMSDCRAEVHWRSIER